VREEINNVNYVSDEQKPGFLYDFDTVFTVKCLDLLSSVRINCLWLQAVKHLRTMQMDVTVPDGRIISVNVDSASTSSEICEMIASKLNVKDSFGFSLLITFDQEVRARFALTPYAHVVIMFLDSPFLP